MDIGHLRALCNNNNISCRDSNGKYLSQTKMVQKLSSLKTVQTGGGLGPDKLWDKYSDALIKRLTADISYTDPLPTELPDTFQSPNHVKYLEWVVKSYLEGGIKRYEDIQSRAYPALSDYALLLLKKKLQGPEINLLNYCGLSGCSIKSRKRPGLDSLLSKYEDVLSLAKGKSKEHDVGKSVPLFSGEQIAVYAPKSKVESQYYGRATQWCTAAKKDCMFDHYYSDGPLYIVVPKNPQYKGEKYQLHFASAQYMDEKDEPIYLLNLIDDYPELLTALFPLIYDGSDIDIYGLRDEYIFEQQQDSIPSQFRQLHGVDAILPYYIIRPKRRSTSSVWDIALPNGDIIINLYSSGYSLGGMQLKMLYKAYPEVSVILIPNIEDDTIYLSMLLDDDLSEADLKYALEHDELIQVFKEHNPDAYSEWLSSIVYYVAANDKYEIAPSSYSEVSNAMKKLEVDDFAMRNGKIIFSGEFDHLVGKNITVDDTILTIHKRYRSKPTE